MIFHSYVSLPEGTQHGSISTPNPIASSLRFQAPGELLCRAGIKHQPYLGGLRQDLRRIYGFFLASNSFNPGPTQSERFGKLSRNKSSCSSARGQVVVLVSANSGVVQKWQSLSEGNPRNANHPPSVVFTTCSNPTTWQSMAQQWRVHGPINGVMWTNDTK